MLCRFQCTHSYFSTFLRSRSPKTKAFPFQPNQKKATLAAKHRRLTYRTQTIQYHVIDPPTVSSYHPRIIHSTFAPCVIILVFVTGAILSLFFSSLVLAVHMMHARAFKVLFFRAPTHLFLLIHLDFRSQHCVSYIQDQFTYLTKKQSPCVILHSYAIKFGPVGASVGKRGGAAFPAATLEDDDLVCALHLQERESSWYTCLADVPRNRIIGTNKILYVLIDMWPVVSPLLTVCHLAFFGPDGYWPKKKSLLRYPLMHWR